MTPDPPPDLSSSTDEGAGDKEGSSKVGKAWRAFNNLTRGAVETDRFVTIAAVRLEQIGSVLEKGIGLLP